MENQVFPGDSPFFIMKRLKFARPGSYSVDPVGPNRTNLYDPGDVIAPNHSNLYDPGDVIAPNRSNLYYSVDPGWKSGFFWYDARIMPE